METLREKIRQYVARLIRRGIMASSPVRGFARMEGHESDPEEPLYQDVVRFLQDYGLRSRPRPGSEMAVIAVLGASNNRVCVATEQPGTGPDNQEEGEVELYSEFGQRIILDKDGQVTVTAKNATIRIGADGQITIDSASGRDVILNGGSATVSREGDMADGGALSVAMGMSGVTAVLYREPGSVIDTVIPVHPATLPIQVKLGPGAPRVKA